LWKLIKLPALSPSGGEGVNLSFSSLAAVFGGEGQGEASEVRK